MMHEFQSQRIAHTPVNLSLPERYLYVVSGAALVAFGVFRRGGAWLAVPAGLFLAAKGMVGSSPLYKRLGINTAVKFQSEAGAASVPHQQGVHVRSSITIHTSPEAIYQVLKEPDNLRRVLPHIQDVQVFDPTRGRWVIRLPAKQTLTTEIEIINDVPNEVIGWRSAGESPIAHAGAVRLKPAHDWGTEVHVEAEYVPPAGVLGTAAATLLGIEPTQLVKEALRNLKQWIETGEIATTDGQPSGRANSGSTAPSNSSASRIDAQSYQPER
ncbi:MAG: DUF2892 domain-containing protein [bacterium]|nr:DUF2892 domain-containing protein [bacterium]